jgi:hypothetical protein
MDLYIRHHTVSEVLVADRDTGYAVAKFFYQCGDDGKPKFNALALALAFINDQHTEDIAALSTSVKHRRD